MSVWLPNSEQVYLPPTPATRILNTDEYVTRTNIFYHANSDRLLTIGHPYFEQRDRQGKVTIPKVSGNQYRVFRMKLPNPNRFALTDTHIYDPSKERLVWGCRGVEVSRGQPLGLGVTGHPYFNRIMDNENPSGPPPAAGDNRQDMACDVKQAQVIMVGCRPQLGEFWKAALPCAPDNPQQPPPEQGHCPPLELLTAVIEDGDMADLGWGCMDFKNLQASKADVPLDLVNNISKYPDYIKMNQDTFGDRLWFYARKEQMFTRHMMSRGGLTNETVPPEFYRSRQDNRTTSSIYYGMPSGSLVSSDNQLFNRPYWLQRATGHNNGICWDEELFVTVLDNTRGTNMTLSVQANQHPQDHYQETDYAQYLRHAEEFELSFIFQLCKVALTPEALTHLHTMDPRILEAWHIGLQPPPSATIEDHYRYIRSLATRCPEKETKAEAEDIYKQYNFWGVDLSTKFSSDLDQFPLGRKFLFQTGVRTLKRTRKTTSTPTTAPKPAKRKRKA
ncbi:L1 [Trichechus manatus latirostris papillomavirus 2]|uniref:Major capsid protein L1 n=1 Tax=Trichechus manatus latirostris papillomavirus 2 TaxID=1144379 RepID=H6UYR1_9PAPI|nr:L1 gene product [Trichechus manatus latirostris papillomavirus 2]AFA26601.1 L1 [Trichechus manatus latirostris papillomavirus 2]